MNKTTHKYIFGPVVSRRYGLSLGVDMVMPKSCSFNCLFCQIGETNCTTVTAVEKPPVERIIDELQQWIAADGECDIITLAGSGEPTLHRDFGRVIMYIKEHTPYPSLLLSNGSLFFKDEVRAQAVKASIVKLSLHSWDQSSFERITRADSSLKFSKIIEGYRKFREAFNGRIDLEVFVLPGINDKPEQMKSIAKTAATFFPDSIYLNTAVRPPAEPSVKQADSESIKQLTELFGEAAAKPAVMPKVAKRVYSDDAVIQLTARHPTSINQLARQFDISHDDLTEKLNTLEKNGFISLHSKDSQTFVSSPS